MTFDFFGPYEEAEDLDNPVTHPWVYYCNDPDCDGHGHPEDYPNGDGVTFEET